MNDTSDFIPETSATVGDRPFNNPGNLRPVGKSKGFMQFATPEEGRRALEDDLAAKGGKGKTTVAKLISQWAPPSDKNDTQSYIKQVAKHLGVGPNDEIDLSDQSLRSKAADAIQIREGTPLAKQVSGAGRGTVNPPQGGAQPQFIGKPQTVDQENASFNARHPDASLTRQVGYGGLPQEARNLVAGTEAAVDSATMGTSDYAIGAAAYAADKARGGNLSFPEVMAAVRSRRQDVTAQHPNSTLIGNVGGAIYTGSGLLKGTTNVVERAIPMASQAAIQSFNDNFKDSISRSTKDMTTEQVIQKGIEDSYNEAGKSGIIGGAFSVGMDTGLAILKRIGESQGGQYAKKYLEDLIKNRPVGWEEKVNKVIQPWRDKLSELTNSEGKPLITPKGQVYEAKVEPPVKQPSHPPSKGPLPVQDRVEPTMVPEPVLSDLAPKPAQVQGSAPEGTMGMLSTTPSPQVTESTPEELDKLFRHLGRTPFDEIPDEPDGKSFEQNLADHGWSFEEWRDKVINNRLERAQRDVAAFPDNPMAKIELELAQDAANLNSKDLVDHGGTVGILPRNRTSSKDTMAMAGEPYMAPGATSEQQSIDDLAKAFQDPVGYRKELAFRDPETFMNGYTEARKQSQQAADDYLTANGFMKNGYPDIEEITDKWNNTPNGHRFWKMHEDNPGYYDPGKKVWSSMGLNGLENNLPLVSTKEDIDALAARREKFNSLPDEVKTKLDEHTSYVDHNEYGQWDQGYNAPDSPYYDAAKNDVDYDKLFNDVTKNHDIVNSLPRVDEVGRLVQAPSSAAPKQIQGSLPNGTMAMSGEPYTGPGATNVAESEDQLAQVLKNDQYPQGITSGPDPWALNPTKEPIPVTQAPMNRDPWSLTSSPNDLGTDEEAASGFAKLMGERYPEDKIFAQGGNPWKEHGIRSMGSSISDLAKPTFGVLANTAGSAFMGGLTDYGIDATKNLLQGKPLPNNYSDYFLGPFAKYGSLGGAILSTGKYGHRIAGPVGLKLATTSGQGLRGVLNGGQVGFNSNIRNTPKLEDTSDFMQDTSDFIPD